MTGKLTKAQRYWLTAFVHGATLADPNNALAPIRRLIKRGMVEQTNMWRGRPYFVITEVGRSALAQVKP